MLIAKFAHSHCSKMSPLLFYSTIFRDRRDSTVGGPLALHTVNLGSQVAFIVPEAAGMIPALRDKSKPWASLPVVPSMKTPNWNKQKNTLLFRPWREYITRDNKEFGFESQCRRFATQLYLLLAMWPWASHSLLCASCLPWYFWKLNENNIKPLKQQLVMSECFTNDRESRFMESLFHIESSLWLDFIFSDTTSPIRLRGPGGLRGCSLTFVPDTKAIVSGPNPGT